MARAPRRDAGIAYQLGQSGDNAPDWVMSDPHFLNQFELGQQNPAKVPAPAPGTPPPTPAGSGGPRRRPSKSGRTGRGGGRGRGGWNRALPNRVQRAIPVPIPGGTTGGLLLGVVLYPIGLSLVRYGAAGPGMWLRAKFLNQPTDATPAPARGGGHGGGGAPRYRAS